MIEQVKIPTLIVTGCGVAVAVSVSFFRSTSAAPGAAEDEYCGHSCNHDANYRYR